MNHEEKVLTKPNGKFKQRKGTFTILVEQPKVYFRTVLIKTLTQHRYLRKPPLKYNYKREN